MASAQTIAKLSSEFKILSGLSGDASTIKDVLPTSPATRLDSRDYDLILVRCTAAALTGAGVTTFAIAAYTAASGGSPTTVVSHAVGTAPDAAGDSLILECTAEQIAECAAAAGTDLRYFCVRLTAANAADNIVVTYFLRGKRQYSGLSADYTA